MKSYKRFYVVLEVEGDEDQPYSGGSEDVALWIDHALGQTRPVEATVFDGLCDLVELESESDLAHGEDRWNCNGEDCRCHWPNICQDCGCLHNESKRGLTEAAKFLLLRLADHPLNATGELAEHLAAIEKEARQ